MEHAGCTRGLSNAIIPNLFECALRLSRGFSHVRSVLSRRRGRSVWAHSAQRMAASPRTGPRAIRPGGVRSCTVRVVGTHPTPAAGPRAPGITPRDETLHIPEGRGTGVTHAVGPLGGHQSPVRTLYRIVWRSALRPRRHAHRTCKASFSSSHFSLVAPALSAVTRRLRLPWTLAPRHSALDPVIQCSQGIAVALRPQFA
jgi:hypothetical protein